jgi:endonuclease G
MKTRFTLFAVFFFLFIQSCKKENSNTESYNEHDTILAVHNFKSVVYSGFPETFESGTKTAYAAANVTLLTGSWNLNDALIGTSSSDRKSGSKSVRIENAGMLTMNFDVTNGASLVSIKHAKYGSDASSTWSLYSSANGGSTWTQEGSTITTSSTTLGTATFTMSYNGNVRFQLRKLSGGRLNVDDFSVTDNPVGPTRDDNMAMGNPSGAVTSTSYPNNYLMVKPQYDLSYNNSIGEPNWVSWHLSTAWLGTTTRCNCFTSDASLPSTFYHVSTSDYTGSGFDRGHQCPSDERNANSTDNAATFLMTNMMPQAPNLNQQTWLGLENYCLTLLNQGNELYIISGGYGSGGTGSNGGVTTSIAGGKVNVPSHYWKVVVVLPVGSNDVSRVSASTRIIAIDMPNTQTVNAQTWGYYRTSVDAIEAITGFDFLSNVPVNVQSSIESVVDNGPMQ